MTRAANARHRALFWLIAVMHLPVAWPGDVAAYNGASGLQDYEAQRRAETSYAVMVFDIHGRRFVYMRDWGGRDQTGSREAAINYARMMISYGGGPRGVRGTFSRDDIQLSRIQLFGSGSDAARRAGDHACSLERQGFTPWVGSYCAPPPRQVQPLSGRLDVSPGSPRVGDDVEFSAVVSDPNSRYAYLEYRWYINGSLVEDHRVYPPQPYNAASLTRSFDTAGSRQIQVQVSSRDSGATINLTRTVSVRPADSPGPSRQTYGEPDVDWEEWLGLLLPALLGLLMLLFIKPLLKLLWWLLSLPFRVLKWLFSLPLRLFASRASAEPLTPGESSEAQPETPDKEPAEQQPQEEAGQEQEQGAGDAGQAGQPPAEKPAGPQAAQEQAPPQQGAAERQAQTPPDQVADAAKAALLLHTRLDKLTPDQLREALRVGLPQGMDVETFGNHLNRRKLDAGFLSKHKQALIEAARESFLTPELVGAVILAEQRDIKKWEELTDWAGSWLSVYKPLSDRVGREASIGLCQRQPGSVIEMGVHHDLGWSGSSDDTALRWKIGSALLDDAKSIRIAGLFVRRMANQAAGLADLPDQFGEAIRRLADGVGKVGGDEPALAKQAKQLTEAAGEVLSRPAADWYRSDPQDLQRRLPLRGWPKRAVDLVRDAERLAQAAEQAAARHAELAPRASALARAAQGFHGLVGEPMQMFVNFNLGGQPPDFALFKEPAAQWSPAHIKFIGWKYNTGHLNSMHTIAGEPLWGHAFLNAYRDIRDAGLFTIPVEAGGGP